MSSYLAFRFIERDDMDFYERLHHKRVAHIKSEDKIEVSTADDIDAELEKIFSTLRGKKIGLLLSGGMDSASLASYLPGADAYTFRFLGGTFHEEELKRAEYYAKTYGLNLHYVDINWQTFEPCIDPVMKAKGAPVHSIEPQFLVASNQAKADGIELIVTGEGCDATFGGMDKLLSRDWLFDDFVKRYTFTEPFAVLNEPVDMSYAFERYRQGDKIDFMGFMDDVYSADSASSCSNAFNTAQIYHFGGYTKFKLGKPLDYARVRAGESKYIVRDAFRKLYPGEEIPRKTPMPRPVNEWFENWQEPTREEFLPHCHETLNGNQRWMVWALERFLNLIES